MGRRERKRRVKRERAEGLPTYIPYIHTYIHTNIHTIKPNFINNRKKKERKSFLPTYIQLHTYLHTVGVHTLFLFFCLCCLSVCSVCPFVIMHHHHPLSCLSVFCLSSCHTTSSSSSSFLSFTYIHTFCLGMVFSPSLLPHLSHVCMYVRRWMTNLPTIPQTSHLHTYIHTYQHTHPCFPHAYIHTYILLIHCLHTSPLLSCLAYCPSSSSLSTYLPTYGLPWFFGQVGMYVCM